MKAVCAVLTAVLLSAGTATLTHVLDARTAAHSAVQTYNDGFVDGVCTGSRSIALADYAQTCKGR